MIEYGTLVFFCGKMGAGKSTKAKELVKTLNAVLISEDEWLSKLFPQEIASFEDYIRFSSILKKFILSHVQDILATGVSVVMDFPGNTKKQRAWFKDIIQKNKCPHKLIYLEADDDLCLAHIAQRRITHPERAHFDTQAVFDRVTQFFEPPYPEEGFNMEIIRQTHSS